MDECTHKGQDLKKLKDPKRSLTYLSSIFNSAHNKQSTRLRYLCEGSAMFVLVLTMSSVEVTVIRREFLLGARFLQ